MIKHPGYNSDGVDNDIALIHLDTPVTFTDYILPVCLSDSNSIFNNGTTSWVTGWGYISEEGTFLVCKESNWCINGKIIIKLCSESIF